MLYRPEVVNNDVEHAQNHNQDDRAPLCLEAHRHHNTCHTTHQNHNHADEAPIAREDESNEQEYQQHSSGKLEIHLAILLVDLRQARRSESLADPAVGEDHEKAAHDAEVA